MILTVIITGRLGGYLTFLSTVEPVSARFCRFNLYETAQFCESVVIHTQLPKPINPTSINTHNKLFSALHNINMSTICIILINFSVSLWN